MRATAKSKMLLRERPVLLVSSISWRGQTITPPGDPIAASGSASGRMAATLASRAFAFRAASRSGSLIRPAIDVPADLSLAVAELVAEAYARRTHVGETSRSQNGQTTISFDPKSMHAAIADKLSNYRRGAPC
jgi:hypothetical protein